MTIIVLKIKITKHCKQEFNIKKIQGIIETILNDNKFRKQSSEEIQMKVETVQYLIKTKST